MPPAERRVTRMVVVSGPPGVGKSRLGWEFRSSGWAQGGDVVAPGPMPLVWGRGGVLGVGRDGAPASGHRRGRPRRGRSRQAGQRPGPAYSLRGTGLRGGTAGPPPGSRCRRRRRGTAGAGKSYSPGGGCSSSALRQTDPVVLIVEDAQYADADLLDFLDYLIDWARDLPIFVLGACPPRTGPGQAGIRHRAQPHHATLDPLDAASMGDWLTPWYPGCHPRAGRRLPPRHRASPCLRWRRCGR